MNFLRQVSWVAIVAAIGVGCSAAAGSNLVGSNGSGGRSGVANESGGVPTINVTDGSVANTLAVHVETPPGLSVTVVPIACGGGCADVEAVVSGSVGSVTLAWEDRSTNPARHLCPTSTARYEVTVRDTGSSTEFARPPETATADLTAKVFDCADGGGAQDAGTCADAPASGTYSGPTSPKDLAGFPLATLTVELRRAGPRYSGTLTATTLGIASDVIPLDGTYDCGTGELVLRGVDLGVGGSTTDAGRPWILAAKNDPATHGLTGDWAYHCVPGTAGCQTSGSLTPPNPHEQAVLPVGDSGSFSLTRTGP
jgi:hypothetical protein